MVARQAPPGLTSMATVESGISTFGPPNQSAKRSGSVHSRHTSSRGASKTRTIVIPGSVAVGFLLARPEPGVKAVEAPLPERTVPLQPRDGVAERRPAEARGTQLRRAAALDQTGPLEA